VRPGTGADAQGLEDDADEGAVNGRKEVCVRGEEAPQGEGERHGPLAKWYGREQVAQASGEVLHAARREAAPLLGWRRRGARSRTRMGAHGPGAAGVGAEDLVATAITANFQEAHLGLPADDDRLQLVLHTRSGALLRGLLRGVCGEALAGFVALAGLGN